MNEKRKKRTIQGDPVKWSLACDSRATDGATLHRRWTVKRGIYGGSCGEDNIVIVWTVRVYVRQRDKSRNEKGNRGSRGRDAAVAVAAAAAFVSELVQGLHLPGKKERTEEHRCCGKWSDSIKAAPVAINLAAFRVVTKSLIAKYPAGVPPVDPRNTGRAHLYAFPGSYITVAVRAFRSAKSPRVANRCPHWSQ